MLAEQHVGALEIAVDDLLLVDVLERGEQLACHPEDLTLAVAPAQHREDVEARANA